MTDQRLEEERADGSRNEIPLPGPVETIDGNFVAAVTTGSLPCVVRPKKLSRPFDSSKRSGDRRPPDNSFVSFRAIMES